VAAARKRDIYLAHGRMSKALAFSLQLIRTNGPDDNAKYDFLECDSCRILILAYHVGGRLILCIRPN